VRVRAAKIQVAMLSVQAGRARQLWEETSGSRRLSAVVSEVCRASQVTESVRADASQTSKLCRPQGFVTHSTSINP
jgi:hypothetical protein